MATPFIKRMYHALRLYNHDPAVGMRLVRQDVRNEHELLAKIRWPHCNTDAALVAALLDMDDALPLIAAWMWKRAPVDNWTTLDRILRFASPQASRVLLNIVRHHT